MKNKAKKFIILLVMSVMLFGNAMSVQAAVNACPPHVMNNFYYSTYTTPSVAHQYKDVNGIWKECYVYTTYKYKHLICAVCGQEYDTILVEETTTHTQTHP